MDTKSFELTDKEILKEMSAVPDMMSAPRFVLCRAVSKRAVSKVLSMLEPVELEALGDEEIRKANPYKDLIRERTYGDARVWEDGVEYGCQTTIQHNSKEQLFRVKE